MPQSAEISGVIAISEQNLARTGGFPFLRLVCLRGRIEREIVKVAADKTWESLLLPLGCVAHG